MILIGFFQPVFTSRTAFLQPVFALSACCAGLCSYRLSFGMVTVRLKASFRLTVTIPQGLIMQKTNLRKAIVPAIFDYSYATIYTKYAFIIEQHKTCIIIS